jgi:hypothetical protein
MRVSEYRRLERLPDQRVMLGNQFADKALLLACETGWAAGHCLQFGVPAQIERLICREPLSHQSDEMRAPDLGDDRGGLHQRWCRTAQFLNCGKHFVWMWEVDDVYGGHGGSFHVMKPRRSGAVWVVGGWLVSRQRSHCSFPPDPVRIADHRRKHHRVHLRQHHCREHVPPVKVV